LGSEVSHVLERFFDVNTTLGTCKSLPLFSINNELESSHFAKELLEVESTFLNEDEVLVTDGFLWGNARNGDSGPSFCDNLVESVKFIEASEAIPITVFI
jgi:hypothetical protein